MYASVHLSDRMLVNTLTAPVTQGSPKYQSQSCRESTSTRVCRCVRGVVLWAALQWQFRNITHRRRLSAERVHWRSPLGLAKHCIGAVSCAVTRAGLRRSWGHGDVVWSREVRIPHFIPPTAIHAVQYALCFSPIDWKLYMKSQSTTVSGGARDIGDREANVGCVSDHSSSSVPTEAPIGSDTEISVPFHSILCLAPMHMQVCWCVRLGARWVPCKGGTG